MNEKKCMICGNKTVSYTKIKGMLICPKCGMVVADISLSSDEVNELYSEKYFMGEEYTDYIADKKLHISNFNKKISIINKKIGSIKNKYIFEIGCAYGFFLDTVKTFSSHISGIDISEDAIRYAREIGNHNVIVGDYLLTNCDEIQGKKPDIICMWDVIEHLTDPSAYLEKVYENLEYGGYICITTGDMGSVNAKLRGRKWRQVHPPTHLSYFSKNTLSLLLNNKGFEVVSVSYLWNLLSIRNIIYSILCLRLNRKRWYDKHKEKWYMNLSIYANFHDYMFIIARKISAE